jgi:protein-tyrosine phosphatase
MVVSLLTPEEEAELDLKGEAAHSRALGLEFKAFPIPDRGVPSSRRDALRFFETLMERLADGRAIGVHCRQGIGLSALVAASLLTLAGVPPGLALERIGVARGRDVPETPEQRRWVEDLAESVITANRVSEGSVGTRTPHINDPLPRPAPGRARRRR